MTTLDKRLTNDSITKKPGTAVLTKDAKRAKSMTKLARFHEHDRRYGYAWGPFSFRTADATPLASPHSEPDTAGTITITDAGSKLSVAAKGNALSFASNSGWGSGGYATDHVHRAVGKALIGKVTFTTRGLFLLGFSDTARVYTTDETDLREVFVLAHANGYLTASQNGTDDGTTPGAGISTLATLVAGVEYELAIVLRAAGAFYLVRGGAFPDWVLLWVSNTDATDELTPIFDNNSGAGKLTDLRLTTLEGVTEWGWAAYRDDVTANNQTADGTLADALIEHTITAATGVTQTLDFRRADANNYLRVEMHQDNSTIKLFEVVDGGAAVEIGTHAYTWTNTSTYRVTVRAEGQAISVRVNGAEQIAVTDSDQFLTATGVKVSTIGANLVVWPLRVGLAQGV